MKEVKKRLQECNTSETVHEKEQNKNVSGMWPLLSSSLTQLPTTPTPSSHSVPGPASLLLPEHMEACPCGWSAPLPTIILAQSLSSVLEPTFVKCSVFIGSALQAQRRDRRCLATGVLHPRQMQYISRPRITRVRALGPSDLVSHPRGGIPGHSSPRGDSRLSTFLQGSPRGRVGRCLGLSFSTSTGHLCHLCPRSTSSRPSPRAACRAEPPPAA
uniref:Uncharacterized protein n=1 Tax=Myotis myotis TaxID=51298 RepID=A0A7J7ZY06_MYOMY|nr:hypothetical protein mMyoMyo1_009881 [Myotis myotis]